MFRQYALILAILATTLGSPASAEVFKTTKYTLIQRMFPRGERHFACTTPDKLKRYLDQGYKAVIKMRSNDKDCGLIAMTAITAWVPKRYQAADGTEYILYQFMVNGYDFYTYYR